MPVELLIGVLLAGVIVNLTLLLWLSRADYVKLHWSRPVRSVVDSMPPRPYEPETPPFRRRALFVAEPVSLPGPVPALVQGPAPVLPNPDRVLPNVPIPSAPGPGPAFAPLWAARAPLTEVLPAGLAGFVSQSASVAPHSNGSDHTLFGDAAPPEESPVQDAGVAEGTIEARPPTAEGDISIGITREALTGQESSGVWSRIMEIENARLLRYRRPVAVVLAEVEGLRQLSELLGDDPVDRLLPVIAGAFRREARSSDLVARIGPNRFGAFLPETDEIQAINYVERVRIVCEPWLDSAAVPLRLAIGWSSPTTASDLEFAIRRAEERMRADRSTPDVAIPPPRAVPARVVSLSPASSFDGATAKGEGAVPPAETGGSKDWTDLQTMPESQVQAPPGDAARTDKGPGTGRSASRTEGGIDS